MIVGAVVLAAGKSERKEQNKLLLRLDGKTLIEGILDALEATGVTESAVVVGYEPEQIIGALKPKMGKFKLVLNVACDRGMASSFQNGLTVLSRVDAVFLVFGDEPVFEPNFLKAMIQKMENNADALIVSPIHNGKKGHPLLFSKQLFGEILSLKETQTIQDLVLAHSDRLVTLETPS